MTDDMTMTLQERVAAYAAFAAAKGWPPAVHVAGDWIVGGWVLGPNYRATKAYHGEYPPGYLPRIAALFPDKQRVLHMFAGKVNLAKMPGDTLDNRVDLSPKYLVDAHQLDGVPLEQYDLVVADPPYTGEDANRYGSPMIDRNRVVRELHRLPSGAHVVWLDQMMVMYSSQVFRQEGLIAVQISTNHRFRSVVIFRRV